MAHLHKGKTVAQFHIAVNGAELVCDHSGALYWPDERLLVVSDLHLEKSSSFARRGQLLPPYDSVRTLSRLYSVVKKYEPQTILSLGDSFHDNNAALRLSHENRALIDDIIRNRQMIWIAGNHDDQQTHLAGSWLEECQIGSLVFRHEPRIDNANGEIAGHLHPAARIVRRGMSIRRFCFATDRKRMILPAFGAYAGGLELSHKAFKSLFDPTALVACLLGNECIYPIQKGAFF